MLWSSLLSLDLVEVGGWPSAGWDCRLVSGGRVILSQSEADQSARQERLNKMVTSFLYFHNFCWTFRSLSNFNPEQVYYYHFLLWPCYKKIYKVFQFPAQQTFILQQLKDVIFSSQENSDQELKPLRYNPALKCDPQLEAMRPERLSKGGTQERNVLRAWDKTTRCIF